MDAGRTETRIYAAEDYDARLAKAACRPDSQRCDEKPSAGAFSELSAVDWRGGPRTTDGSREADLCEPRGASICEAARLSRDGLHSRLPGNYCRDSAARWGGCLRISRALADHHEADAAADSRNRAVRGEADSRRDGQGDPFHWIQGQFP